MMSCSSKLKDIDQSNPNDTTISSIKNDTTETKKEINNDNKNSSPLIRSRNKKPEKFNFDDKKILSEDVLSEIDSGRLNYLLEDTMEVGKVYIVEISISKNLSKNDVITRVRTFKGKEKNIKDTIIRITKDMEIKLIDPIGDCFKINSISDMNQIIENREVTIWRWNVIPIKDGDNDLNVVINVILGDSHKSYTIYEGKIHVFMKNKFWIKTKEFMFSNIEILIGSILVPLIGWLFTVYILPLFKKKRKNKI